MTRKRNKKSKIKTKSVKKEKIVKKKKDEYRIGVIKKCGDVKAFNAKNKDDMEMKILKIMDKDNFKKIVVFNNRTNKREYHYPG